MAGFGDAPYIEKLAIPAVSLLVIFLGYSSQYLFHTAEDLEPGPLSRRESIIFNTLLCCIWYTYYKTCTVDPGRYVFPSLPSLPSRADQKPQKPATDGRNDDEQDDERRREELSRRINANPNHYARWCRKCEAPKPPRAHHCRTCARCIPRMDHHCPWTTNCVSLTTFPHFLRFLSYTNLSLWYLARLLFARFAALWRVRHLPSYLGPSLASLVHLSLLAGVAFFASFALGLLLFSTARGWLLNTTSIEGWEMERHEELLRRRGRRKEHWWGDEDEKKEEDDAEDEDEDDDDYNDGGPRERIEFPYDLGFFENLSQAMGTRNVLAWPLPWAGNPVIAPTEGKGVGWEWEENGFNRREGLWPPPDPEKLRTQWPARADPARDGAVLPTYASTEEQVAAFRRRQEADLRRWRGNRSKLMAELEEVGAEHDDLPRRNKHDKREVKARAGWANSDGETLRDYGVDEETETDDQQQQQRQTTERADDDVPLAELLRRRKVPVKDAEGSRHSILERQLSQPARPHAFVTQRPSYDGSSKKNTHTQDTPSNSRGESFPILEAIPAPLLVASMTEPKSVARVFQKR
ncbi:zf-DHHC-domain-containing protein [Sodiomyces alkalinus F11]|uniref:Palmitoyltransferase PFA4 n=1 Tax=Sodiomyces alkalinus (strain CBS 110278 / VKM F-3762 / F11) TaxID=1314773 RepID=A0A3N2QA39_SODAK|nr:zf-DHHC-domain-containing protein [Sodiomyces alkalinus F11]ROT43634.1 zf-DHHC-domain-containing protein [Sodiomyces alkalinus F11]